MTPLTAAQVAKARKGWNAALALDLSPNSQAIGVALWASVWAEPLLAAAEILTALQDAFQFPQVVPHPPQPAQDPDT